MNRWRVPRTVEATAAGTFAMIDMTAFKSRVIKTYAGSILRLGISS